MEVERTNRDDTCIEWHVGGVCRQMFKIKSKKLRNQGQKGGPNLGRR